MSKKLLGQSLIVASLTLMSGFHSSLRAQGIYATLTGTVADPSQAVLPQADVKLIDMQSKSRRDTVTNRDGYFTFASVPLGTYELYLTATGFESYKMTDIPLDRRDKKNLNIT